MCVCVCACVCVCDSLSLSLPVEANGKRIGTMTLQRPGSRRCEVVYFSERATLMKLEVEEFVSAGISFISPSGASSKPAVRGVQLGSRFP